MLSAAHRVTIAGCATNRVFAPGEAHPARGRPGRRLLRHPRGDRGDRDDRARPRGRHGRDAGATGDVLGWSWLVPPYRMRVRCPLARDDPRDRPRRRLPARQVRRATPRSATSCSSSSRPCSPTACRRRGCGCWTSTGRPAECADAGPLPRFRVTEKRRETRRHVDAAPGAARRRRPLRRSRRASSRWSTPSASGEVPISVSATRTRGAVVHTVRAVGAVTRAICARGAGRRARRARAVRHGLAGGRGRRPRRRHRGGRASACAPLRPALRALLARPRALRAGHAPLRRPHPRGAALPRRAGRVAGGGDVDVRVTVDRAGRLGRVASGSSRSS